MVGSSDLVAEVSRVMYRPQTDSYAFKNFWGLSASMLGAYEAIAYISNKRAPTISTWAARRRARKIGLVAWTLGLAFHIARHNVEDL